MNKLLPWNMTHQKFKVQAGVAWATGHTPKASICWRSTQEICLPKFNQWSASCLKLIDANTLSDATLESDCLTLLPRAEIIKMIAKQGTSWDSRLRVTKSIKPPLGIQFLWARHECNLLHLTCQTPTTNRETINSDVLELLWQDSLATGLAKFAAWQACGTGPLEFMVQRTYLTAVYREARNCSEYQFKPISGCVSKGCFAASTFKDHSGQNHSKEKWSTWASTKTVAGT